MSMAAIPHGLEGNLAAPVLHVALELGAKQWKVGFTPRLGRSPRIRTLSAGDLEGLEREIERAKRRFGLPEDVRVVCCYEAGRDGFWIHRALVSRGLENHVVDSASIEVNRRKRRRKSDGLDLGSLLRMLARYVGGVARTTARHRRFAQAGKRARRRGITAVARKLLIALWH